MIAVSSPTVSDTSAIPRTHPRGSLQSPQIPSSFLSRYGSIVSVHTRHSCEAETHAASLYRPSVVMSENGDSVPTSEEKNSVNVTTDADKGLQERETTNVAHPEVSVGSIARLFPSHFD